VRHINSPVLGILLAGWVAAASAAAGDIPEHPALNDRFYLGAGLFFPKTTTQAQLRSKTVPNFFGRWRINNRWRIEAEYFEMNRSSDRVIDRQIEWGDQVFPVNTTVSSKFNFSDLRVSAGYSFFRTPDKELGVGLGLHMASYDVRLSTPTGSGDGEDVLAPLPVLSLYAQFALTERWALSTRLDRFSLAYDKFDGGLTALGIDVLYQPFRHVGFGVSYRSLFVRAEIEGDRATASFRQAFEGPMIFMNASW
jgi:outer membrane protein with beta-barrel domain